MSPKQRIEASTKVTSDECIFTWTIENYRLIKSKVGEKIESPQFGIGRDNKQYFQLLLYPKGDTAECAEYISLFLEPVIDSTNKSSKIICKCKISAIIDEKVVNKAEMHHDFASTPNWGFKKFFPRNDINKIISSENTVTIQCELEIFKEYKSSLKPEIISSKDELINTIKFDFSFLNEEFSDVKLIVEEQEIPAHKIVLAAASPVFRAMFTHDMLENLENSVKIMDITENIVNEMLRFIYTGKFDATETDKIIELLAVADKYQIDSLKIRCEKMLHADLSSENAIDILMKKIDDHDIWVNLTQSIVKSQKNIS
ncbi:hypothetical protein TKK_0003638 [Trichogramma kaykai]